MSANERRARRPVLSPRWAAAVACLLGLVALWVLLTNSRALRDTASRTPTPALISNPSSSPVATGNPVTEAAYQFFDEPRVGRPVAVSVYHPAGVVASGRGATAAEVEQLESKLTAEAGVFEGRKPTSLVIAWIGSACDRVVTIVVQVGRVVVAPGPRLGCDPVPLARAVELEMLAALTHPLPSIEYVPPRVITNEEPTAPASTPDALDP